MDNDPLLERRVWKLPQLESESPSKGAEIDAVPSSAFPTPLGSLERFGATDLFSAVPETPDTVETGDPPMPPGEIANVASAVEPIKDLPRFSESAELTRSFDAPAAVRPPIAISEEIPSCERNLEVEESVLTRVFDASRDYAAPPPAIISEPLADPGDATGLFSLSAQPDSDGTETRRFRPSVIEPDRSSQVVERAPVLAKKRASVPAMLTIALLCLAAVAWALFFGLRN